MEVGGVGPPPVIHARVVQELLFPTMLIAGQWLRGLQSVGKTRGLRAHGRRIGARECARGAHQRGESACYAWRLVAHGAVNAWKDYRRIGVMMEKFAGLRTAILRISPVIVFRFSWKWRRRSPTKLWRERMKKQRKHYNAGRKGRHPQATFAGEGAHLEAVR
jgi:hypothetical protein